VGVEAVQSGETDSLRQISPGCLSVHSLSHNRISDLGPQKSC